MRYIFVFMCLLGLGCNKLPGDGGQAFVRGKVEKEVRLVLSNPSTVVATYPAADEDVFILYGENISPDDRVLTNYDGEFEFQFLRKGKYTIYVYSEDTIASGATDPSRMPVIVDFEITDKKEDIDLGTLRIYEKN
jgi:hypothetical protein